MEREGERKSEEGREGGRDVMPVMTVLLSAKHHTCPSYLLASSGCCGAR